MTLPYRPLTPSDLPEAERIFRQAFGTFLGLPDPQQFTGDAGTVRSRWGAFPEGAFGVDCEGTLAGSVFVSRWGSFGFFGPLSVDPRFWGKGLAKVLMGAVMDRFEAWGIDHAGLYTFPNSPLHLGLYGAFGFRPRFLTAVMARPVGEPGAMPSLLSGLPEAQRAGLLAACRDLTGDLLPGLDLTRECLHPLENALGDLVYIEDGRGLAGFAICHTGAGSEAGSGACYVKFAAARSGEGADQRFTRLVEAIDAFAGACGARVVLTGVNTARTGAYESLLQGGFRIQMTGIALHRPNEAGFSHPDAWVLDDWR